MRQTVLVKIGTTAIALALILGQGAALASTGSQSAGLRAAAYLKTKIHADGGFGTKDSTVTETSQAIIALKSAGAKLPRSASGKTPIDYLKANVKDIADADSTAVVKNAGKIAILVVALEYAGEDPKKFAGTDWLARLEKSREKATGWYGELAIVHCWAMLALESAGETIDPVSVGWLTQNQEDNGGFALDKKPGLGADTNTTALAIQALIGAGEKPTSTSVKKALDYLKTQQNKDGGFPFVIPAGGAAESDANSTAWVIQALLAAGQDIEAKEWVKTNVTPIGFLMSLQNADGAFGYQRGLTDDNFAATTQAVPALVNDSFPHRRAAVAKPDTGPNATTQTWLVGGGLAAIFAVIAAGLYFGVIRKKA